MVMTRKRRSVFLVGSRWLSLVLPERPEEEEEEEYVLVLMVSAHRHLDGWHWRLWRWSSSMGEGAMESKPSK
jgi:hypothetical protein